MSKIRQITNNIQANVRDDGSIGSYAVRVSVASKDIRLTHKTLEEAIESRDKLLSKQYQDAQRRLAKKERLNFKHWGYC